jgi:DNA-binding NarL/FixJ family response regulator
MRVLLVDDEPVVVTALALNLRRLEPDWIVLTAHDMRGALAKLDEYPVDAVVCDLHLEHEDGLELLAELRRHWPQTARLALSGMIDAEHLIQVQSRAHRHLVKPCRSTVLRDAIIAAIAAAVADPQP